MYLLAALSCLLVTVQSRGSRDFALLRSIQPVEFKQEANEKTQISYIETDNKDQEAGTGNRKNETADPPRDSRGLMKKLSFLGGMKAGGLISSSGTLAASNSLRIFGKVMNTALSVSYGHVNDLDPLPEIESDQSSGGDDKEVRLKPEMTTIQPLKSVRKQFLKTHNAQVGRINHKFLRTDSWGRSS